jgi:hypothetical protein
MAVLTRDDEPAQNLLQMVAVLRFNASLPHSVWPRMITTAQHTLGQRVSFTGSLVCGVTLSTTQGLDS